MGIIEIRKCKLEKSDKLMANATINPERLQYLDDIGAVLASNGYEEHFIEVGNLLRIIDYSLRGHPPRWLEKLAKQAKDRNLAFIIARP